jgi:molybdate transport system regulatory protein
VLFKESEVILAAGDPGAISLRNRLRCRILGREAGALLTHFRLGYQDQTLHALITTGSAEMLGLRDGDEVTTMVKTTEVSLGREPG